jgi:hypothetical protein
VVLAKGYQQQGRDLFLGRKTEDNGFPELIIGPFKKCLKGFFLALIRLAIALIEIPKQQRIEFPQTPPATPAE